MPTRFDSIAILLFRTSKKKEIFNTFTIYLNTTNKLIIKILNIYICYYLAIHGCHFRNTICDDMTCKLHSFLVNNAQVTIRFLTRFTRVD